LEYYYKYNIQFLKTYGEVQFMFFLSFLQSSENHSTSENLYGHFLYILERAKITLIKSKECCTNTIKYRKDVDDVIWGTNKNNTVPFE
jgi:hypothetical protein